MAYIKQNFKDGETLSAEQLNYIEDAIYVLSTGENIEYTNTWYTDVSPLDLTTECSNDSNGWSYSLENDCNAIRNVPINLAKFVTTSRYGKVKLGVTTKGSSTMSKIVTGEFSKDNDTKEVVVVRLSENITLASNEYLVIEPYISASDAFSSKENKYVFYYGQLENHNGFISRIPSDLEKGGANPWRENTGNCIGWSFGYTNAPSGIGSGDVEDTVNIKVDDKMSSTSENAVSNKVIKDYIDRETSFRGAEYFNFDFYNDKYDTTYLKGGFKASDVTENGYKLPSYSSKVLINRNIDIDYVNIIADITLTNTSTSVALGSKSYNSTAHASCITFDFSNKKMIFAKKGNQDTISSAFTSVDISDVVNTNDLHYYIEIGRRRRQLYGAIVNYRTGKRIEHTIIESGSNLIYPCGWLYDNPTIGKVSGSDVYVKNIKCYVPTDVKIVFLGDSITEGYGTRSDECWAVLCCDYFGNSINMGRSGATLPAHTMYQIDELLPVIKPKYVVVTIGTNGGNTAALLEQMVEKIQKLEAIPIINHIYRKTANITSVNDEINSVVEKYGLLTSRFDYATSVNNDLSSAQDLTLFLSSDKLHLNVEGNKRVFERFKSDCGYINFVK